MHVQDWLTTATRQLSDAGIATARLDCLVLLEDELAKSRAWLLSHPEYDLQGSEIENLHTKIVQRAQHIPLAYLRGHAEFYGREFIVNAHTLVPRPETESMIELLKDLLPRHAELVSASRGSSRGILKQVQDDARIAIADIGTGSGAIAITAKLELPEAHVIAIDIDKKCLEAAEQNAEKLGADVAFLHGNLLEPLATNHSPLTTILLANLPYVPDNFQINTAATHEPRHALFGGPDGLDLYRTMFEQIAAADWKPQYILAESLPPQHEMLTQIAKATGFHLQETSDFIQMFRIGD